VVVTGHHSVEANGAGSRARLSLHFGGGLGPVVARIFRRLNTRYLELEAAGLRRRSEAREERSDGAVGHSSIPLAAPTAAR